MCVWDNHVDVMKAKAIAKKYYDKKTFAHAERVSQYVAENYFIPVMFQPVCVCLAWMHDLLEDTEYANDPKFELRAADPYLQEMFDVALQLLTKPKKMDYISYIQRFHDKKIQPATRYVAWCVKLADMKDHLSETDTLTDKLKDKYLKALPYLL